LAKANDELAIRSDNDRLVILKFSKGDGKTESDGRSEEQKLFCSQTGVASASESENSRLKEEKQVEGAYREDRRPLAGQPVSERPMIGLWSRKFSGWPICCPTNRK
jgi:hypothetical protein